MVCEGDAVTIVAVSNMVVEAQKAARWVKNQSGHTVEIIDIHCLSPVNHELIRRSVAKTSRLIIADSGSIPFGLAAEVARGITEHDPRILSRPVISLGMQFCPTPTSHALENFFYPDMSNIVNAIYMQITGQNNHPYAVPTASEVKSTKVDFKGPF